MINWIWRLNGKAAQAVFTVEESAMAKKSKLPPGTPAPGSGQYREVGPRGGKGREVTSTKRHPLPPTTKPKRTYKFVDPTKNKSGEGE
jgi:hypothetical protein